jgi:hypothetical protein
VSAVAEIGTGDCESDFFHLVIATTCTTEHFARVASAGRTGSRLASREGDGSDSARGKICARQISLEVFNARRSHSLTPQEHALRRIAEPARILLTHDEREEVCDVLIEMHQEPVFGMEIDQGSCEPGDRRKIADCWPGYSYLSPSIGFQNPIIARLDQARFPSDVESIGHLIFSPYVEVAADKPG